MISISKRRLVSLASTSALVATMAVASVPAATFAADPAHDTGFMRDGKNLTAKQIGGVVTGNLDATGYDIGVYNPTSVSNADIHGARYHGVVVDGTNVNVTNSKVHDIGDFPFNGVQVGRAITYVNGASGTISGNKVYDFQKNGIEVINVGPDGVTPPTGIKTFATVKNNIVTGEGRIDYIAQNGIVIRAGADATVVKNTISGFYYTPTETYATGLLLYANGGGTVDASGNKFAANEVNFEGTIGTPGRVRP